VLAAMLTFALLPASAQASSPCARSLGNGVVARLCQLPATQTSARHKVVIHATGYRLATKRGAAELRGAKPLRTGLPVRVSALRIKGTKIELLYTHNGGEWLVRYSNLKGRGALRGKVSSHWTGSRLQVRLHSGDRSLRPTSVRAIKAMVLPTPPTAPIPPRVPRIAHGGGGCAVPDQNYDNYFQRGGPGWTGGDGTYSVGLPDGRTAWSFGDSYLGTISPDGSRPLSAPIVNNSMLIASASSATTLVGGTPSQPQALVSTGESGSWYWPGASTVEGGTLVQFLSKTRRTGSGLWDFAYAGSYMATYSLPGMSLQSVVPVPASDTIQWGAWTLSDGGYTYIYGIEDRGWDKYVHVARVSAGALSGAWQYYTGSAWSTDPTSSARLMDGASNQFSVVKMGSDYQLISQAPLGSQISSYHATSPVGPFGTKKVLYTTPNWGASTFTYNAVAHPDLSGAGEMLISFNVNTNQGSDLYSNPEIYRPRFVRAASSCFGS
jgi:hypothetical protein